MSKKRESHKQALRQLLDRYVHNITVRGQPFLTEQLADEILCINDRFNSSPNLDESTPKSLLDWGPDGLYDDSRAVHLHGRCHAARDGECAWRQCPQLKSYKTHCPLDKETSDED